MAAKILREMQAPIDVGTVDGQQLITQIVSCYINACETTKVARDWEKVGLTVIATFDVLLHSAKLSDNA